MGKPRSNKKRNLQDAGSEKKDKQPPSKKKRKGKATHHRKNKKRFWIEDCKETWPKSGEPALTVIISRATLTDDHMHPQTAEKGLASTPQVSLDDTGDHPGVEAPAPVASEDAKMAQHLLEKQSPNKKTSQVASPKKSDQDDSNQVNTTNRDNLTAGSTQNSFISVKRAESAKGPLALNPLYSPDYKPLPNGDCGDGIVNPFPKSEVPDKYWAQRRRLFSRFDQGIELDRESWFSVTPEVIANHIADRVVQVTSQRDEVEDRDESREPGIVILDAFCGCGGNSIAFACREEVSLVVCVDTDRSKLLKAAKNASIYGVSTAKIVFLEADACQVMASFRGGKNCYENAGTSTDNVFDCHGFRIGGLDLLPDRLDAIFLSPPWGGTEYASVGPRNFDLATHIKVVSTHGDKVTDGEELLQIATSALLDKKVVLFLPRNTNGISVGKSSLKAGYSGDIELEQHVVNGKLKTLSAYLGFFGGKEQLRSPVVVTTTTEKS